MDKEQSFKQEALEENRCRYEGWPTAVVILSDLILSEMHVFIHSSTARKNMLEQWKNSNLI